MNRRTLSVLCVFALGLAGNVFAQGTAFNYQGQLSDAGAPANAPYDFRFAVFDAVTNGTQVSASLTNAAVPASNGLFNVTLDFGTNVFMGASRWLDIAVRAVGVTNFTVLAPRQPVLPVPYAMFATTASNVLGSVSAAQLTGTASSPVNFTNNNNTFAGTFNGTFAGNGAALTALNASQLATGTVPDARLSNNVARLDRDQTYSGANNFTNWNNNFTGNFFGNGLVGWLAVTGTVQQAVRDTGYLLLNSSRTTVILPPSGALQLGDIVRVSGPKVGGWLVAQNTNQSILGQFYTANNSTWVQANAVSAGWVGLASSSDGVKMVASAQGGSGIYTSSDSGKNWVKVTGTYTPLSVASSSDGSKLFGANNGGSIIYSTNSGVTWKVAGGTASTAWNAIACSADGARAVAVVNAVAGRIYTSADSGVTWTLRSSDAGTWFAVASSANGSNLVAAIYGGRIYTSTNAGVNWTQRTGAPNGNWTALASSADGSRLAAANFGGKIYTSEDFGATWAQQTNSPSGNWYALASSADGNRLVAAINGGNVYVSANGGLTWVAQGSTAQNWRAVTTSADGTIMAAGYAATLTSGLIFYRQAVSQFTQTTTGAAGSLVGGQGSAVELQYIGNNQFIPVSSQGVFWAN